MAKPGPGPTDIDVGARIRLRRKAIGITQSDLADALGVTFQQVQKYERGVNRVSATALVKIASRLDCPITELLGQEGGGIAEPIAPTTLVTPAAVELLDVYAKINDGRARSALLALARALSDVASSQREAAAA